MDKKRIRDAIESMKRRLLIAELVLDAEGKSWLMPTILEDSLVIWQEFVIDVCEVKE